VRQKPERKPESGDHGRGTVHFSHGLTSRIRHTIGLLDGGRVHVMWVTRERPKTDRIACPWLIRRFIEPEAEIVYVPADTVLETARREGGRSFDAEGADYTHRDGKCSFEVLIEDFDLADDPALERLARIVHAADVSEDLQSEPEGAGLLAVGIGGLDVELDDQRLLERGSFVYDALYAYCRQSA
jgi:hypothetical protein